MFSSILLFAFSGYVTQASIVVPPPSWNRDYSIALEKGVQVKKPVAIIVGSGLSGWQGISKNGEIAKEVHQLLDEDFVCVYVDSSTDSGKKMADALSVGSGPALIIGDRSGTNQAFRYRGALTSNQLEATLKRYAKVGSVASVTESSVPSTTTSSPAPSRSYPSYVPPSSFSSGCIGGH